MIGMLMAIIARFKAPHYQDAYFGCMKFVHDHWIGRAAGPTGESIEVMLLGSKAENPDFSRQRTMYRELLERYRDIVLEALPLIERHVVEMGYGPPDSYRFLSEMELNHVVLPDPGGGDSRWELTVEGPWLGVPRSDDDDSNRKYGMFVIEVDGWRPVSVELS